MPIFAKSAQHKEGVVDYAYGLKEGLANVARVGIDASDKKPGWKFNEYEMKGIPLRLEVGPKDIEKNQVVLVRRDRKEKIIVPIERLNETVAELLEQMQQDLYDKALQHREEKTTPATNLASFNEALATETGFIKAMWCGDQGCEDKIKEETGATSRCIPFVQEDISEQCVCCGTKAKHMVYWGKAY
jgi:prolyl-tRNA synthetase